MTDKHYPGGTLVTDMVKRAREGFVAGHKLFDEVLVAGKDVVPELIKLGGVLIELGTLILRIADVVAKLTKKD